LSGVRTAWVSSSGVAPSPPCLISSDAGSMSSAVFISESQLVVALAPTLLLEVAVAGIVIAGVVIAGVAVTGIAVARIALVVSTVTATVTPSSQEIFQTKEPDTNFILSWSLAFPPPAAVTAVVAPKQSEQTSVGFITVSLSFPSPTGVRWTVEVAVEVAVASIKSPAENSSSQEPGTNTKNPAINQLVACADKPGVCRGILAIRAAGAAGTGAIAARVAT